MNQIINDTTLKVKKHLMRLSMINTVDFGLLSFLYPYLLLENIQVRL